MQFSFRSFLHLYIYIPCFFLAVCLVGMLSLAPRAEAVEIVLDVADIKAEQIEVRNIKVHLAQGSRQALVRVGLVQIVDWVFSEVTLSCPEFIYQGTNVDCRRGTLRLGPDLPEWPVMFRYDGKEAALTIDPGLNGQWYLTWAADRGVSLQAVDADFGKLTKRVPLPEGTALSGLVDAEMKWKNKQLTGRVGVKEASFNDAPGTHAGDRLSFAVSFSLRPETPEEVKARMAQASRESATENRQGSSRTNGNASQGGATQAPSATAAPARRNRVFDPARITWLWQASLDWQGGEVFWQPFYFPQAQFKLDINGKFSTGGEGRRDRLRIDRAVLDIASVGKMTFDGALMQGEEGLELRRAILSTDNLNLKNAGRIFLAPWLAQNAHPALDLDGTAGVELDFTRGKLNSVSVDLHDASVNEARGRFGLEKITGRFTLKPGELVEHNVKVGGAQLGRLQFGTFDMTFFLSEKQLEIPRIVVPVLDSEMHVENLLADNHSGKWRWEAAFSLLPVSLPLLTEVLEFPRMEGQVSAFIPKISQDGVDIILDGGLVLQVFDGYVAADHLKIIDLLGHLPRVETNLDIQHIDLGLLTRTFSFGSIEGFIDASVKGLVIASWKPIKFDAKVMSSDGSYRKKISQRAVENITALGGPGTAAAIQRSVLRFFEDFGYRRLGLSCVLDNGVCIMGGVAEDSSGGYTIVEGGGIPALSVVGYNRRVDWNELIERLQRVISSNLTPTIK